MPINSGTKPRDKCLRRWTRREAQMAKSKLLNVNGKRMSVKYDDPQRCFMHFVTISDCMARASAAD
jgi:hypothetical protein